MAKCLYLRRFFRFFEDIACVNTTDEKLVQTRFQCLSFHDAQKRKTLETILLPTGSLRSKSYKKYFKTRG